MLFIIIGVLLNLDSKINNTNTTTTTTTSNEKITHLASLTAKSINLVPLKAYKAEQDAIFNSNKHNNVTDHENTNDDEEEKTCYFDIKIQNELNKTLDYKIIKSFNLSNSCASIPLELVSSESSNSSEDIKNKLHSSSSVFSADQIKSSNSLDSSLITSTSESSLSSISNSSLALQHTSTNTSDLAKTNESNSSLKAEYVPEGKIITISVSIMW